jgi:mRNA interferase RelE/StbE
VSEAYTVSLSSRARRALHTLPAKVADAALVFVSGPLANDPRRVGHPLRPPFQGQWSAHLSTYRVFYRIDEDKRAVIVLDVVGRADAYYPGRA